MTQRTTDLDDADRADRDDRDGRERDDRAPAGDDPPGTDFEDPGRVVLDDPDRTEQLEADADGDEREFVVTPEGALVGPTDAPLGDPEDRAGGRDEPR